MAETSCSNSDQRDLRANELAVSSSSDLRRRAAELPPNQSHQGDNVMQEPGGEFKETWPHVPLFERLLTFLYGSHLATSNLLCVWVSNLETRSVTQNKASEAYGPAYAGL